MGQLRHGLWGNVGPAGSRALSAKTSRIRVWQSRHWHVLQHHQGIMLAPGRSKRSSTRAASQQSQQRAVLEAKRPKDARGGWQVKRRITSSPASKGEHRSSGEGQGSTETGRHAARRFSAQPSATPAPDSSCGPPVTRALARRLFVAEGNSSPGAVGALCATIVLTTMSSKLESTLLSKRKFT